MRVLTLYPFSEKGGADRLHQRERLHGDQAGWLRDLGKYTA